MLFIDTLLLSPIYGTIWAARQIRNAMEQERTAEPARITAELSELYMMLETGGITTAEFDAREKILLDQLDSLQEPEPSRPMKVPRKQKRDAGRVKSKKKSILKSAAIIILPFWICLSAQAVAATNSTPGADQKRLAALAMVETACRSESACRADRLVGRRGEVSRYQILPAVWRQHYRPAAAVRQRPWSAPRNPAEAKGVARRIMDARIATFVKATSREPNDLEWYALWNAPGAFGRVGYVARRLSPIVKERARRFSNLMARADILLSAKGT